MKTSTRLLTAILLTLTCFTFPGKGNAQDTTVRIYQSKDAWYGTYYNKSTVGNTNNIRIGGWGDAYIGLWHFDTDVIPRGSVIKSAILYIFPDATLNNGLNLVKSARLWLLTNKWNENGTSGSNFQGFSYGSFNLIKSTGLTVDGDYAKNMVDWWVNVDYNNLPTNNGIALVPEQTNNNSFNFPSRESSGTKPRLLVTYEGLKMPLPGNKSWRVNTAIGDSRLASHSEANYYSIDFGARSANNANETNVPVYAAGSGIVTTSAYNPRPANGTQSNGYYVVIDHDSDNDTRTGIQTRYLHLAGQSSLREGNRVTKGQFIGTMGKSGTDAIHLHFGIAYRGSSSNSGLSGTTLSQIKVDGVLLGDFVEGSFYQSTNTR